MSKTIRKFAPSSLIFAFIIIVFGSYVIVAQETVSGTWKAETSAESADGIQVSFNRKTERSKNNFGSSFKFSDFEGLSRSQTEGGKVRFRLVREAGIIECEGSFAGGKGAGTFRFAIDKNYVERMKSRGFDFEKPSKDDRESQTEDRLFAAAALDVTTALADDLLSANFGKLEIDDLFKAAIFKINSKFITEMRASGFPDLEMEDLVKARIFKIDADFVRRVAETGLATDSFEDVIQMRIFKITPEYIKEIRGEGFADLGIEDLVEMKIFNINAEFIRAARAEGVPIKVGTLIEKRIGVWRK